MKQISQDFLFKNKNLGFEFGRKSLKIKTLVFKFPDSNLKGGGFNINTPVAMNSYDHGDARPS